MKKKGFGVMLAAAFAACAFMLPAGLGSAAAYAAGSDWTDISGELGVGDYSVIVYADAPAHYTFTPAETALYTFTSEVDKDTRCSIYRADGTLAAAGDDISKNNKNFSVSVKLSAGETYYVELDYYNRTMGIITGTVEKKSLGWEKKGDSWYYVGDNGYITNRIARIGTKYYCFDSYGVMPSADRGNLGFLGYSELTGKEGLETVRAKKDGSLYVNEWYKDPSGLWYYYDESASMVMGKVITVKGKKYGFDRHGAMYADTLFQPGITGAVYYAKASGDLVTDSFILMVQVLVPSLKETNGIT